MPTTRKFDVCTPRPKFGGKRGEVWWHQVGNAAENDKGQISVWLNSVPVPDPQSDNQIVLMLFEKRDREQQEDESPKRRGGSAAPTKGRGGQDEDQDEIPF